MTLNLNNRSYLCKALDDLNIQYKLADTTNGLVTDGHYSVHEKVDVLITSIKGKNIKECIGFAVDSNGNFTATGDFHGTGYSAQSLSTAITTGAKKMEATDMLTGLGFEQPTITETANEIVMLFDRW